MPSTPALVATLVHTPAQPSHGAADSSPSVAAGFLGAGASLLAVLRQHPDAARRSGDCDPARVNGLQQVQLLDSGEISIVWSWGVVMLPAATSVADLANYLRRASA